MKYILITLYIFLAALGAIAQPENGFANQPAPPVIFQQCLNKEVPPPIFIRVKSLLLIFGLHGAHRVLQISRTLINWLKHFRIKILFSQP